MAEADAALFDMATLSHAGHARQHNQDYFFTSPSLGLSLVADGVGGQGDGAWASHRLVELFPGGLKAAPAWASREDAIGAALLAANGAMLSENREQDRAPSGTTVAGIWAPDGVDGPVTAFNVGDSSVFHFSGHIATKVSRDHSLYQMWVDGGCVGKPPARRTIMQAIGISETLAHHFHGFAAMPGDTVLICTDGLTGTLSVSEMTAVLAAAKSSRGACEMLLSMVLRGPASDNVTVSVCRF